MDEIMKISTWTYWLGVAILLITAACSDKEDSYAERWRQIDAQRVTTTIDPNAPTTVPPPTTTTTLVTDLWIQMNTPEGPIWVSKAPVIIGGRECVVMVMKDVLKERVDETTYSGYGHGTGMGIGVGLAGNIDCDWSKPSVLR
jgi:hypothetical protein